ncbi:MAG: phosphatase PAP2 family protein [Gemmatimonadota bacterium]
MPDRDVSDRYTALSLGVLSVYLVVMVVPLVGLAARTATWAPLAMHTAMLSAVVCALVCGTFPSRIVRTVRDWTPLAVGPFLYIELRWIIEGVGRPHLDALVRGWEASAFASDPSRTLAAQLHSSALSEVLHLCYLAYYALIYAPPALLTLTGSRNAFVRSTFALVVVYCLCFATYALLPVDGPRFLLGPSDAPDGPVRSIVIALLESGSSRGTAFPSSHVAASVVATMSALRFQRALGIVMVFVTIGLGFGAVYGGYHYAVDVVAGLFVGIAATGVARVVERRLL